MLFRSKIALWGNSGAHYGLGIQNALLQIHSNDFLSDIAFGYGSSSSFTETMRIKGNGNLGIGTSAPAQNSMSLEIFLPPAQSQVPLLLSLQILDIKKIFVCSPIRLQKSMPSGACLIPTNQQTSRIKDSPRLNK